MHGATRKEWLGIGGMMLCCASIMAWPTLTESPAIKRLVPLSAADQKLIDAVKNDDLQTVKIALEEGADVNCQDKTQFRDRGYSTYYTPLLLTMFDSSKQRAARNGKPKSLSIMKLLLAKGANPNLMGNSSYISTPLCIAVSSKNWTKVSLLLKAGADVNLTLPNTDTPVGRCFISGNLQMAQLLYSKGADLNKIGEFQRTPLHNCVSYSNSSESVEWLISKGADVNTADKRGRSPLHSVVEDGYYESAELLVKAGAKVNAADKSGLTPLDLARQYATSSIARDFNKYRNPNETPTQVQAKLINVLERHGKTPTPQTNHA